LDMVTVELLAEALNKYDGTIILVSHDRYFISKTANKIWEIEDEKIIEFKGGYQEWLEWKERMAKAKIATSEPAKNTTTKENKKQSKPEPVAKAAEPNVAIDKDLQKQIQKLQRAIAQLEHNIETLQKEKLDIEAQMADSTIYSDTQKFHVVEKSYQDKNALIRSMNKEYEIAFNDLLILESK